MNTINNYVEAMFMNLPKTAELISLKDEMLSNMGDKYEALKASGVAENEAIGIVISEFGQIDELLSECDTTGKYNSEETDIFKTLSKETITNYLLTKRKIGFEVGLGVLLCGVASAVILGGVHYNNHIIGVSLAIFILAFAISLFIMAGIRQSHFSGLEEGFSLTEHDKKRLESDKKEYEKSFYFTLILGIALCMISSIPVIISSQYPQNILLGVILTVLIAASGIFFIIYCGNVNRSFSFLLKNGMAEGLSLDEMTRQMSLRKLNENIWYIVLIVYFLFSFIFQSWAYSWVIFLMGAFLSNVLVDRKKND